MLLQAGEHILPGAGKIRQGDELRGQAEVAQVFRDVPADAAVDIADIPGVAAAGDVGGGWITLDIHENTTDDCDAHIRPLLSLFSLFSY
jgi:hypothetical protein